MKLPFFQVDAFTGSPFKGNPAGVTLLEDQWLEDDLMQSIAAENNLSETAFILQCQDVFALRWFTPVVEVDLCGHATIAAAHVLFHELDYRAHQVDFQTLSGNVSVHRGSGLLELDFPSRPPVACPMPEDLQSALGRIPQECLSARDLLLVYESETILRELKPDFDAMMGWDAFAVIATAPGDEVDFVSRFFAPKAGVPEDPVTGSAHCTLVPYWVDRLGKKRLQARQISKRGGELACRLLGNRVRIAGNAVTYLRGEIEV